VRSSVADVYKQVLEFKFAEANLPLTNEIVASNNTTRAHRNAIALKTRVYLSMGESIQKLPEGNKLFHPLLLLAQRRCY
jgi:hypothetical protein